MSTRSLESEDMFEDTRMSFGDHLEELRQHLWRAIFGFLIALFFSFFIGKYVLRIISAPVEEQLLEFHDRPPQKIKQELGAGDEFYTKFNLPIEQKWEFSAEDLVKQILPGDEKAAEKVM